MAQQYKILHPVKYYRDFMSYDIRPDGRELLKFRPVIVNVGSISTADGSAIVKIGNTTVVCGIKAELAQPKTEEPSKGYLIPNVELPPLCSSRFRPGPPSDQAQVTSRLVADIIENFKCIDLTELCIAPDKLVWVLYCDLVCLDHDGALTDACVAAVIAALKTVSLPEVQYDAEINKKTVLEESRKPLNITNIPVSTTYAIFDDSIILADPTSEEENLCTGIITISISGSQLYSLHKPGGSPLNDEQIDICVEESKKRSKLINNLLTTALSSYDDNKKS